MWLFYVEHNYCPCGSDGAMMVPKNIKSARGVQKQAELFLGKRYGRVYMMPSWTQEMCEMAPDRFTCYIMRNGKLLAKNED